MGLEIERKFLVLNDDWKELIQSSSKIVQSYLIADDRMNLRVRFIDSETLLTIKGPSDPRGRLEVEFPISADDGSSLIETLSIGKVEKTRFFLDISPGIWSVDVFEAENAGLVVLEIEYDVPGVIHVLPNWVGLEVTDDKSYSNARLVK